MPDLLSNFWLRPILFGIGLAITALSGFAVWSFFVFAVLAIALYWRAPRDKHLLKYSYLSLIVFSPAVLWLLSDSFKAGALADYLLVGAVLVISALFLVADSLAGFKFERRFFVYNILNTAVLVLASSSLFALMAPGFLGVFALLLFIFVFLNISEALTFFGLARRRRRALAGVVSFLAVQIGWLLSLLTLGAVNSSVFLVLFVVLIRDIFVVHHQGNLSLNFIFRQLTFLVFLTVIIFATSQWTL